jgi:hypothetical protein
MMLLLIARVLKLIRCSVSVAGSGFQASLILSMMPSWPRCRNNSYKRRDSSDRTVFGLWGVTRE